MGHRRGEPGREVLRMHQCNPVLRRDGYVILCIDPPPDNHENQWYGKGRRMALRCACADHLVSYPGQENDDRMPRKVYTSRAPSARSR